MTEPIAPQPFTGSQWTPPPVLPARIGALRAAGRLTTALLAVVIVALVADLVLTPWAVADPTGPFVLADFGVVLVQVVAMVGTAAAMMTWLFIAMKNLRDWRIRLRWGPGWAIGAWFIPLANLVLPVLVVNEAATASASPPDVHSAPQRAGAGLIAAWWATFLLGTCFVRASSAKTFAPDEGDYALGYATPGALCYVAAAVLGMLVMRHITGLQVRRQAALDALNQLRPGSA